MKHLLAFALSLILLLSLALPACADIVGYAGADDYIHRYLAPNGQELFFVSWEKEPPIEFEDVNGDGVEDIVVITAIGASNFFAEFFVWDGEKYVWAQHVGEALANYAVTPEGFVVSHGKSGMAGALFEDRVFAWNGTELKLIRKMVSDYDETWEMTETEMTTTQRLDALHITLYDYASEEGEQLLWETRVMIEELNEGDIFTEMDAKLWEGLTL